MCFQKISLSAGSVIWKIAIALRLTGPFGRFLGGLLENKIGRYYVLSFLIITVAIIPLIPTDSGDNDLTLYDLSS